jgi:hypothetical protein
MFLQRDCILWSEYNEFFLEGPRSRSYGRTEALKLIVQLCDEDYLFFFHFFRVMEDRWNEIDRGKPKYSSCPSATLSTTIPQGLVRDRTRTSAMGGRRLTF